MGDSSPNASGELRKRLEGAGIEYGKLGDYTTSVTCNGISFVFDDCYDGMLTADIVRLTPDEAESIVKGCHGHAAKRYVYYGDGVGHTECASCGRTVVSGSSYCSWCGIEFRGIERVVK